MPQLLVVALVAGAGLLVWRAVGREMRRVGEELRREEERAAKPAVVPLEAGEDGVYRPRESQGTADRG